MKRPSEMIVVLTLTSCAPVGGISELHFQAAPPVPEGTMLDAARLLLDQRVPQNLLLSVPEAVARAPEGSLILVCNERQTLTSFWGICSHLSRKIAPGWLTDTPHPFAGGVQNRPESTLYHRHAVIVLDIGVKTSDLPALKAAAERLKATPYLVSGEGAALDCTTYQNVLQRALNLPVAAERNTQWNLFLPQDVLTGPAMRAGGKVLWVGVQPPGKQ